MKKVGMILFLIFSLMACGKQDAPNKNVDLVGETASAYDEIVKAESWTADVTLSVVTDASNSDEVYGQVWNHSIEKVVNYVGTFTPYPNGPYLSTTRYWKLTTAWVYAKINDETFETLSGDKTRFTLIGTKDFNIKDIIKTEIGFDSIILDFSSKSGYKIFIPEIMIEAYSTRYKTNEPGNIDEGPTKNNFSLPGAELNSLAYPGSAAAITGSKTVKKMIFGASGNGMMLDVTVTWEFKPATPLGPL